MEKAGLHRPAQTFPGHDGGRVPFGPFDRFGIDPFRLQVGEAGVVLALDRLWRLDHGRLFLHDGLRQMSQMWEKILQVQGLGLRVRPD